MGLLQELRAKAKANNRRVGKKISRLKTQKGANLAGTRYDPRRTNAIIDKLNTKQLNALIGRQDTFMGRGTQFVGTRSGDIISSKSYERYKRAARRYNNRIEARRAAVAHVSLSSQSGETLGNLYKQEQRSRMKKRMKVPISHEPKPVDILQPQSIQTPGAIDKMADYLEYRMTPAGEYERVRSNRTSFDKMIEEFGDEKIFNAVNQLSNEQFDFLWNETNFSHHLSSMYEGAKIYQSGNDEQYFIADALTSRSNYDSMIDAINDAKQVGHGKEATQ